MSSAAGEEAPKLPEEIEAEIETTREQLGDTVEALAAKADVKAQAKERITSIKDAAQDKKAEFALRARDATPGSAAAGVQQIAATVERRPVPFAVAGAFAGGMLVGWILRRG